MSNQSATKPTRAQIQRWRRYLADEVAEGAIYRTLAQKKTGQEKQILLGLAEAEARHEEHWRTKLGEHAKPVRPSLRRIILRFLARNFGSVFAASVPQHGRPASAEMTLPASGMLWLVHEES